MRWYSGPIQDAIASAKHDQKIFLVFVEGKDETSKTMGQIITEEDVSKVVDENCVSVKLITDSEPFRQFSQIYPVIVVPSMFFIGNNGIPLEVIAGSEDKEELILKIQKAIQLHKSKLPDPGASVSATSSASAREPIAGASASAVSSTSKQEPVIAQEPKTTLAPTSTSDKEEHETSTKEELPSEAEEANAQALLKQKLERAEQLMAERRRLREQEEKEAERDREMEQRRAGRELQRAREQMKEKEMADWAKQRQKEKQEDKAARERVLAQIAQDKADRAARFQYSGSSPPPASGGGSEEPPSVRQRSPPESASASVSSQATKIQFRLPNSQAISQEFPAGSTLNDVVQHVNQVIKPGVSAFSLATSFPRRHFTKADHSRTLRELELCPSAVLLVLPASAVSATSHSSNSGRFWALVWTVLSPLTVVWNFIYSFVFGSGPTQQTAPVQNDVRGSATSDSTAPQSHQRSAGNKTGSNQKSSESASRYRRDGNIHHLSNESSNDDEDGTWNGNSTQQM